MSQASPPITVLRLFLAPPMFILFWSVDMNLKIVCVQKKGTIQETVTYESEDVFSSPVAVAEGVESEGCSLSAA